MTNELTTITRPVDLDVVDRSLINQIPAAVKAIQDAGIPVLPVFIGGSV